MAEQQGEIGEQRKERQRTGRGGGWAGDQRRAQHRRIPCRLAGCPDYPAFGGAGAVSPDAPNLPAHSKLRHAVRLEPGEHALPAVLGRVLAEARTVVGVEAVRHAWKDMDLGGPGVLVARLLERLEQLVDLL